MKIIPSVFLSLLFIASISCKKDKDCSAPALESNLVGSWSLTALGQNLGDVEFKADGTLVDPSDVLIDAEFNGMTLDQKTWEVTGANAFDAKASNGSNFISVTYDVTDNQCDEITLDVFGIEAKMARK